MDLQQEIKSFGPIDIESFAQSNKKSEKDINSIQLYNKAIEYLKAGNDDIAMIELKKVVSANPSFYEAVNLLGLCYAYTNQLENAEELFKSIMERENNAIKAADYLNFISITDTTSNKKTTKSKNKQTNHTVEKVMTEPIKKSQPSKNIATENIVFDKIGSKFVKPRTSVIINAISVICLIIAIILFVGASKGAKNTDNAEPTDIKQATNSVDNSSAELNDLKTQLQEANTKLKQYELSSQVSQVSNLYAQKKYIEAADKLMSIKVDELSADLKENYNSTKDKVLLSAANQLLTEGNTMYKSGNYPEAVKKLEKLFTLGDKWDFADKALYILGKSYVEINDKPKATTTYEKLINEHPNSSYVKYAKGRLKAIQ